MGLRRELEPKLEAFWDKKLATNAFAQQAIMNKLPRLVMVEAAKASVGHKEKTGKNDGEFIELYQETIGGSDGEPYCVSGVESLIAYAEKKTGIISHMIATESSRLLYTETPKIYHVKKICLPGAIAVWADIGKFTGHAEIVLADDGEIFHAIGWNTSGTTKPGSVVNREGNGVYYTVRNRKATKTRKLLGFVKPF